MSEKAVVKTEKDAEKEILYLIENPDGKICGVPANRSIHFSLVSIEDVRDELNQVKFDLAIGLSRFSSINIWSRGGYVVVQEGVYKWDEQLQDYYLTGHVNSNGETIIQQKEVIVPEKKFAVMNVSHDFTFPVYLEDENEDEDLSIGNMHAFFHAHKGTFYEIIHSFTRQFGEYTEVFHLIQVAPEYTPFAISDRFVEVVIGHEGIQRARETKVEIEE